MHGDTRGDSTSAGAHAAVLIREGEAYAVEVNVLTQVDAAPAKASRRSTPQKVHHNSALCVRRRRKAKGARRKAQVKIRKAVDCITA